MKKELHIAITGAGLVGSLLAIYLKNRGYQVSVFERRNDMRKSASYEGRSINLALSNRGIRALEEVGLAEELKKEAIPMHGRMIHDLQGHLNFQPYGKAGQYINSISRSGLNKVLMTKAESLGVEFHFEQRVTAVDFEKTELTIQHSTFNIQHSPFDLIIGSDGAFSAVRLAMQFTDQFNFSQSYIEHGYKELHIPTGVAGSFQMEKNALHIWPRESYMLIALPNPDGSFTLTLFFPFTGETSFETLSTKEKVTDFFKSVFPDAYALMPQLLEEFFQNPSSSLVTMRCYPWVRNKTLLIGDAAHAIVPFYGQGMNAGFEDCRVLNQLLDQFADDWDQVLPSFQEIRKPNADAIAKLALDNFVEMRDLVNDADFILRKKIESKLHELFPEKWIPLYSMVTFHENIPYSVAYETGQKQKRIMEGVLKQLDIEKNWENLDFKEIVERL
ncbi:MAG: FAD-dependent monooxygenase [Cytophagales bacterium]|jgi:kynurenine 3-monooxygenase|nr:FAD-dependent monooxygenase [Cytophagales bacterium]MCA6365777.1 FAD-dependent monooxygenase [Cytophagales bacterium]MCA6372853.1 FAD-dependent monooxygenase [Cytophagales bacterium]MCA6376116.1 FAD-dependent monooxygenase [Cytophagales bacterium]MCA6384128.1 FAD-dependent monooxygenase [Cytophagales bacterium]